MGAIGKKPLTSYDTWGRFTLKSMVLKTICGAGIKCFRKFLLSNITPCFVLSQYFKVVITNKSQIFCFKRKKSGVFEQSFGNSIFMKMQCSNLQETNILMYKTPDTNLNVNYKKVSI